VVNSPARDLPGSLSSDGLTLYLQSARSGGFGGNDIWISRRDCPTCAWKAPENLGDVINTASFDGSPALSRDGCLLFFASEGHGARASDIFVSRRPDTGDDLGWERPVNLGPDVNSDGHEGGAKLLQLGDGNSELYYNSDRRGLGNEIYRAPVTREGEARAPGSPVEELNDPDVQDQGATISRNGRELIFWSGGQSRTRPGSVGLADLWVSTRRSIRDPWSAPENLGAPVNSPFADLEPVLSTDGRTLFFSSGSARRPGLGMTDIWMTTRAPNASEPGEQTEGDDGGEGGDKVGSRAHRRCPDMR
jgi:hypothetical protein